MGQNVAILLCTHNGEKYLSEQLDSILKQKDITPHIYISDDNSTDNTIKIIKQFKKKYPNNFKILFKVNFKSVCKNFLYLIKKVKNYKYYAFSDQDDVWMEDKLKQALLILNQGYDLYCGRTSITDQKLQFQSFSTLIQKKPSFQNAIVENISGGNTMVFNYKIFKLLKKNSNASIIMHDWWAYILSTFAGFNIFYDPNAYILYRQHSANYSGEAISFISMLKRKIFRGLIFGLLGYYKDSSTKHINELSKIQNIGTKENIKTLNSFKLLRENCFLHNFSIRRIKSSKIYRQTLKGNFAFKLALFLKRA
jgi:glycosyltransferase involved in cell wall biosynthesis